MLSLNTKLYAAEVDGKTVELTNVEFSILNLLLSDEGQVYTKKQIIEEIWDGRKKPLPNTIEVYVKYIRNKIGDDYIRNRRGFGYYAVAEL